jgi:DNA-binding NarL/FixJ family response regulator
VIGGGTMTGSLQVSGREEGNPMLRVAVVEDDPRYRAGLEQLFASADGFALAASFGNPDAALDRLRRAVEQGAPLPWDAMTMDLETPGMGGIEATRRVKAIAPELRVVVLTVFEQPDTIVEAIRAGADGYLLKRSRARQLLDGVRAAFDGGAPLTPQVARRVLELVRSEGAGEHGPGPSRLDLTPREQDVLRALVDGKSYQEVADALGLSLGTVRTHLTAVYRKLHVHSAAEAVSRALRDRIV